MTIATWITRTVSLVVLLCGLAAGTAQAQAAEGGSVGLSYSFLRLLDDDGGEGVNMPAGWLVSFAQPIARSPVSFVGEAAGNYKSESGETLQLYTFQGGVRVSAPSRQGVTPFAQFLAGMMTLHCCSESEAYFAIEPGGGVDIALTRRVSLRLAASFPTAFSDGDASRTFRFQTGIAIPLGPR